MEPNSCYKSFSSQNQVSLKIFYQPKTPKKSDQQQGESPGHHLKSPWKPTLVSTCRRRRQSSQFPRCAHHIKAFQPSGLRAFGRFCDWVATGQAPNPNGKKYNKNITKTNMTVILQYDIISGQFYIYNFIYSTS